MKSDISDSDSSNPEADLSVFVYGTLKPGGRFHVRFCGMYLTEAIPAMVKGRLYNFPRLGYPAMTVGDDWVKGALLRFAQSPEICADILQGLDKLEGYSPKRGDIENEYLRCEMTVFDRAQQPLQMAWGYVMSEDEVRSRGGIYLPDGIWA
ncbi:gamma-glutamylcyclotransferase [cf. Phormidesmis sp. LEGE 11477]|uniref:gamma-glutamylcyclotransferase family protein n=1 Tax=cf. Phormidesmis sp. LEGE 11477 TaxID=1828680 RepID=UPI001880A0D9|nr:gamma-glutamylcyclotransferase family protein [cf. Phormidesmis sp. LEGE 11477]MBE9059776.1 gamma-glutamylcyclotransferase [cf. Phormidesmis sp. LEGE 11477]